eukprot:gene12941-7521_t
MTSQNQTLWYNTELPKVNYKTEKKFLKVQEVEALFVYADSLQQKKKSKTDTFEHKIMSTGTFSDKIAAITLLLQKNLVGNLDLIDSMLQLCGSKSSKVCELAIDSFKDLLIHALLPPNRELIHFKDQNLSIIQQGVKEKNKDVDTILLQYFIEETIKTKYDQFISILEEKSHNNIDQIKVKVLISARMLISKSPEQRIPLCEILIKRFSDKSKKICGKALQFLLNIINMTSETNPYYVKNFDRLAVVQEVSDYLLNPHTKLESKIYAATFLSKIELNNEYDKNVSKLLISTYVQICKVYFDMKTVDIRLIGCVLAGIYRAITFSTLNSQDYIENIETLFKIARISQFNVAVESMRVIWAIVESSGDPKLNSRYYTLLYDKLLDKGMRSSSKIQIFLNLFLKSVKADSNIVRSKAIVKRLLQSSLCTDASYTCSCLIILREVFLYKPALKTLLSEKEDQHSKKKKLNEEDEDDEEYYEDKDEENESMDFKFNAEKKNEKKETFKYLYNPKEIRPQESGADSTCLWELALLRDYYHPSAAKFSELIMGNARTLNYDGNPLQDFSLTSFLDKFNYKQPKAPKKSNYVKSNNLLVLSKPLVNSKEFLETPSKLIREDEKFYFKYMKQRENQKEKERNIKKEKRQEFKEIKEAKKKRKISEISKLHDENYSYSYDDLDNLELDDDHMNEEQIDDMMIEYASSDDEDGKEFLKEMKKKKKFAFDVTEGDIADSSKANQDDVATMLEPDSDDYDSDKEDGNKKKNRWSVSKRAKRINIPKRKKQKERK